MTDRRTVTVPVDEIKQTFYVRCRLNEDHMLALALVLDAGQVLPPLTITADKELVDGRHRLEALKYLNRKEAVCVVTTVTDRAELIGMAMKANMGGSLPPTRTDLEHSIQQLVEQGLSRNRIMELVPLPKSAVRKIVDVVQSNLAKARMKRAMNAVADGKLTPAQAAEHHGVDIEDLRKALRGERRSRIKTSGTVKGELTRKFKSLAQAQARRLQAILQQFDDGEISARSAEAVFKHNEQLITGLTRRYRDWFGRFEAAKKRQAA